ncbi:MAG TPA: metalloregulator ArsR/SmtB family transcription factor [Blastocatellia bacterium]|jgi:ArsR family transcriptional regulator|nr:metalloregulator ArsR/SmtB family transcription factor [Blastocatellia bacterium]
MNKKEKKFDLEMFFRALGDRTRLRLINLMSGGEVCVCFFVEVLGTNQPKISRHLAYLRRAGIVAARREGKWMHYRINTPANTYAAALLSDVQACLAQDKEMQRDRAGLLKVCCEVNLPIQLQGAPRPVRLSA